MFGLLNIYKSAGGTSRGVVDYVMRLVKPDKVGHAGTLDPLASGVLVICIGRATRLVPFVQQMSKRYVATFRLGCSSDTDDIQGEITTLADAPVVRREEIEAAIPQFLGDIQQRPPTYSAVKVGGKRAYAMARQGTPLELAPRPVTVNEFRILSYTYPDLRLEIQCGSGTYIRALGRDLAQALGTAAVMSELVRTAIGPFRADEAVHLDALTANSVADLILPALCALDGRPLVTLGPEKIQRVIQGRFLDFPDHGFDGPVAAVDDQRELIAVLCPHSAHQLRPDVVLRQ